jgi:hypothetical protein
VGFSSRMVLAKCGKTKGASFGSVWIQISVICLSYPSFEATPRNAAPIRSLMEFYASEDDSDDEESENDLMVQLSGMIGEQNGWNEPA